MIDLALKFKELAYSKTVEDRIKGLSIQTQHPQYGEFVAHCMERYGEHPMVIELRDLAAQMEHGLGDDENEPETGPINPRYGRIRGRETFWPFHEYLQQKDFDARLEEGVHRDI